MIVFRLRSCYLYLALKFHKCKGVTKNIEIIWIFKYITRVLEADRLDKSISKTQADFHCKKIVRIKIWQKYYKKHNRKKQGFWQICVLKSYFSQLQIILCRRSLACLTLLETLEAGLPKWWFALQLRGLPKWLCGKAGPGPD